ncbi:helix-turn-helix domain-containing protein [Nocardia brasiliensis]|uniref:helix-turn-helix domain-containing protein n=1 Tax=Nocardia brasiliensis TaxID=37326 RepID=UPI00366D82BB
MDVVFGIHDDKAVELGRRIKELEERLRLARTDHATTQAFLDEQELGTRIEVELARDHAERTSAEVIAPLPAWTAKFMLRRPSLTNCVPGTAMPLVAPNKRQRCFVTARHSCAGLSHCANSTRTTSRNSPCSPKPGRCSIQVKVCPACLTDLGTTAQIVDGHCTLCTSESHEPADHPQADDHRSSITRSTITGSDSSLTAAKFDVSSELRATRARLAEITHYVEELDTEIKHQRAEYSEAETREAELAREVDAATNLAVSPFLSQRDDLMRRRQNSTANLERYPSSTSRSSTATFTLDHILRETADQGARSQSPAARPRALRHRITTDDKATILADYEAGASTKQLAAKYRLGKGTILDILHTGGATIREQRHLTQTEIDYAITRYQQGESLARIGNHLGVAHTTIRTALQRRGIARRDTHGRPLLERSVGQ